MLDSRRLRRFRDGVAGDEGEGILVSRLNVTALGSLLKGRKLVLRLGQMSLMLVVVAEHNEQLSRSATVENGPGCDVEGVACWMYFSMSRVWSP